MKTKHRNGKIHEKVQFDTLTAEIRVDANGVFTCEIGDKEKSGLLPELRRWAKNELASSLKLIWHPVVEVHATMEDTITNYLKHGVDLGYNIQRYYVAWNGKHWLKCPWAVQDKGVSICSPHNPSNEEQVPLTEEVLAGQRIANSEKCSMLEKISEVVVWPVVRDDAWRGRAYLVPYSEFTWETMIATFQKMRDLRAQVDAMLSTQEGWKQLAATAGTLQLSSGSPLALLALPK